MNYFIHRLLDDSGYKSILNVKRCGQKLDFQFMEQLHWQD